MAANNPNKTQFLCFCFGKEITFFNRPRGPACFIPVNNPKSHLRSSSSVCSPSVRLVCPSAAAGVVRGEVSAKLDQVVLGHQADLGN